MLKGAMDELVVGDPAFLSTDKRGDITLTRMGLTRPRRLKVKKTRA